MRRRGEEASRLRIPWCHTTHRHNLSLPLPLSPSSHDTLSNHSQTPQRAAPLPRPFAPQQLSRCVKLLEMPRVQQQDAVRVNDGVQPVRDRQHRAVAEGGADGLLYQAVGGVVDVGGGLIKNQDLHGTGKCGVGEDKV